MPAARRLVAREGGIVGARLRLATWHAKVGGVGADAGMRDWLTTPGSLTARLVESSATFRVRRLHQKSATCAFEETAPLGLARRARVWEREVLLCCDGVPVVFGHTVVPMAATASDWPLFSALGERSLGTTLFYDPKVKRGPLEFARLRTGHPLLASVRAALGGELDGHEFHARRCVYRRHRGLLMVTEIFLPAVLNLTATATIKIAK
ncbi:chorismate lyase [Massilia sp. CFBP 13647]|uniref:chorismate--pyruvate lyase family protein n=1 Tax=unclassified Massilia TaxID=2609279 RepID=UPI0035A5F27D